MKLRLFSLIAVFGVFTAYTAEIVWEHGYLGFLRLAADGGWGAQVFIDLCIALVLFIGWMIGDSRRYRIPAWPYVAAVLTTGSIGALAYLIHRTVKEDSAGSEPATSPVAQRSM
ncbi:MAG TPA: hypothetical protein VLS88_12965 [Polyangiales bacterium]|nr:hypothetical protein [Polyangiales bacterium]